MTTALITDLGRIRALRVIAKRAVLPFKASTLPAHVIAESLHADVLVEGGIERSGDRFRLDLQLIDAASGDQLWADRFSVMSSNRSAQSWSPEAASISCKSRRNRSPDRSMPPSTRTSACRDSAITCAGRVRSEERRVGE